MSIRSVRIFGFALFVGVPATALAALPPSALLRARTTASDHVQIEVTRVTPPQRDLGDCVIEGKVVSVFKGSLRLQTPVRVTLSCLGPAIGRAPRPEQPFPGGAIYTATQDVQRARYFEAFMTGTPPNIVNDQAVIIAAPSTTPRCNAATPGQRCVPQSIATGATR